MGPVARSEELLVSLSEAVIILTILLVAAAMVAGAVFVILAIGKRMRSGRP